MTDTCERAMKEAETWLVSAQDKLALAQENEGDAVVCCSMAIHAIIRANDALTLKFLEIKSTRHDDASVLFAKLLKRGDLPVEDNRFVGLLNRAMKDKSGADYGKGSFGYGEAKRYVHEAQEFISAMKTRIK